MESIPNQSSDHTPEFSASPPEPKVAPEQAAVAGNYFPGEIIVAGDLAAAKDLLAKQGIQVLKADAIDAPTAGGVLCRHGIRVVRPHARRSRGDLDARHHE